MQIAAAGGAAARESRVHHSGKHASNHARCPYRPLRRHGRLDRQCRLQRGQNSVRSTLQKVTFICEHGLTPLRNSFSVFRSAFAADHAACITITSAARRKLQQQHVI